MTSPEAPRLDDAQLSRLAERLSQRICSIPTEELRTRTAGAELGALAPPVASVVVGRMVRGARDRRVFADALQAFARALGRGELDPEWVGASLACARSRADRLAEALFATGPATREYDVNEEQFVDKRLRALSLGERRALSKTRDGDLLARLAHDQDPRVLRELLSNPRCTEREALLAASRRPTRPEVLETVLASRFGSSRRVRRAVAHNPYAPLALAVRALAALTSTELERVATDQRLGDGLRQHARSLLLGRRTTPAERARPAALPAAPPDLELEELLAVLEAEADDTVEIVPVEE